MRDFLRLLIIAVLSFVVVGGALLYSRGNEGLSGFVSALNADRLLGMGSATAEASEEPEDGLSRLWIARPAPQQWMGLAGFPDSYEVRFPIPQGVSFARAALDLRFESQLTAHGDGRMTVSVNGTRRGEVVLDSGVSAHAVNIDLEPDDLLGDKIIVALTARGTTSGGQICPVDASNSGAAITLLPQSGLALYTADPVDSLAVRVATLTDPMRLALGSTSDEQANAVWAAQVLTRAGAETIILAGTADIAMGAASGSSLGVDTSGRIIVAGEQGIEALLARRTALDASVLEAAQWPIGAEQLKAETLVKNFRGSRRWALDYKLADLENGVMPTRLDLALRTSLLAPGSDWVVRVSLNGNLLTTGRFDGQVDTITLPVDLPIERQTLANAILIELIDTSPNDSICRVGPDAQAQLLPETQLVAGVEQPDNGWGEMVRVLSRASEIGLTVDGMLNELQAREASTLLGSFLPAGANVVFGSEAQSAPVSIRLIGVGQLQAAMRLAGVMSAIGDGQLVIIAGNGTDPLLAPLASSAAQSAITHLGENGIVMLVAR